MNPIYLDAFYHVVSQGGFSAAADFLQVSKGLVSRQVRALEKQLGCQLLHRTTRVVTLTEAGQRLYHYAQQINDLKRQAALQLSALQQGESGLLRFTCPLSLGEHLLPWVIERFRQQCPQVQLELNLTNQNFKLSNGDQDIAIRASAQWPDDVVAHPLGWMRNILVTSPTYAERHPLPRHPEHLLSHNCILNSHQPAWNRWQLVPRARQSVLTSVTVQVQGNLAINQYTSSLHLSQSLSEAGIASLPYYLVEQAISQGRLIQVLADYDVLTHSLAILHAYQQPLPRKIQVFKQILLDWFNQHPQYRHSVLG